MRHIPNAATRLIVAGNCHTALVPWKGFAWTDAHIPRTERPVRFQFRQWREDVDRRIVRRADSRVVA